MNRTLDPSRASWLESANARSADFPIQNLPFGVFRRAGTGGPGAIGVAAKPRHPNAARLFVDFALSRKAQELFRSANRVPARRDVEPPSPKMEQSKLKLRLVPQDSSTRYNEYVKDFRAIFGL